MRNHRLTTIPIAIMSAMALAGCGGMNSGGSSDQAGRGAIQISVKWPTAAQSRLIPFTTQSIKVVVTSTGGATLASPPLIVKPIGTQAGTPNPITISDLPAGTVIVTANAYPQPDGTGNAQAKGVLTASVVAGKTTTTPALTMATKVDHILLTPSATSAPVGGQITVTASPRDLDNNVLIVSADRLSGVVADSTVFSSTHAGYTFTLTGLKAGSSGFTVTDPESGKSGTVTLNATTSSPTSIVVADNTGLQLVGLDAVPPASPTHFPVVYGGTGPTTVSQDSQGRIYYAGGSGIQRVNNLQDTNPLSYTADMFVSMVHVDAQGRIYYFTLGATSYVVRRIDDMTGANKVEYAGPAGSTLGAVGGIGTDSLGRIYMADGGIRNRIIRIDDMTGANTVTFGAFGTGVNQFSMATLPGTHMLAIDNKDRIYIADYNNSRIVRFDNMTGANWTAFTIPANGTFSVKPNSVAVRTSGRADPDIYFTTQNFVYKMDDMAGTNLVKYGGSTIFRGNTGLVLKP